MPKQKSTQTQNIVDLQADVEELRANDWADLPPKMRNFAYAYIQSYCHLAAAEEAGYARESGIRLLRDPRIAALIQDLQRAYGERNFINRDFVNMQWLKLLPKVMGEEMVQLGIHKDGWQMEGYEFNAPAATKVLTELSKAVNFYQNTGDDDPAPVVTFEVVDAAEDERIADE